MANIEKPIWSVDGQTLTNVLVNNKSTTYNKVSNWYDGTPMDDSKLDDDFVYVKYEGEYLVRNMEEGQVLQKDTMQDMRDLSSYEILLLKMGVYKHVQLNGYYEKGDTPAPIDYFLSDTVDGDDGGSVISIGSIKLQHDFISYVHPEYFGTKDNEDSTSSLKKCSDYSYKYSKPVKGVGEYEITDTVQFRYDVDINISYNGNNSNTAVVIGSEQEVTTKLNIDISVRNTNSPNWEENEFIGCEIINIQESKIHIKNIVGFSQGVVFKAYGNKGFVYNSILLGNLENNRYAVNLESEDRGWVNENEIFNGRFWNHSSLFPEISRVGVRIYASDEGVNENAYITNNNNIFYKPSFELRNNGLPIKIEGGRYNTFKNIRNEGNGNIVVETTGKSYFNEVEIGYMVGSLSNYNNIVEDTGEYPSTSLRNTSFDAYNGYKKVSFEQIRFIEHLFNINSSEIQSSSNFVGFAKRVDGTNPVRLGGITIDKDLGVVKPTTSSCVFIRIDTSVNKRIRIKQSVLNKKYGRVYLRLFSNSNENISLLSNIFTAPTTTDPFNNPIEEAVQFGGSVRETGNRTNSKYFTFSNEVEYCDIIFVGDNEGMDLSSVTIDFIDDRSCLMPVRNDTLSTFYSEEAPMGSFRKGQFVHYGGSRNDILGFKNISTNPTVPNFIEIPILDKSSAVEVISTPDATDEQETQDLVNELKDKVNELLLAMKDSGQMED